MVFAGGDSPGCGRSVGSLKPDRQIDAASPANGSHRSGSELFYIGMLQGLPPGVSTGSLPVL